MKYCLVKLLYNYINLEFTYHTDIFVSIGDIVLVSLKNNEYWGIITEISNYKKNFITKPILKVIYLFDKYHYFIATLSNYYLIKKEILYKRIINDLVRIEKKEVSELNYQNIKKNILEKEQEEIFNNIINHYKTKKKIPYLLHGHTGAGKSHIYISIIKYFLDQNKSVILLFPNAYLAHVISNTIKQYIEKDRCFEYHSQDNTKNRKQLWQNILNKKSIVVCGVHLPIFLPITNIGAIIVDEEHDTNYVFQKYPYINSKEAALIYAKINNIFILLGSATPSITSLFNAFNEKYQYFLLANRFYKTALPQISVIQISQKDRLTYMPKEVQDSISQTLNRKEQVLLYLNKKGLYKYAQCNGCKNVYICKNCDIALTIFAHNMGKCSRCDYKEIIPTICKYCQAKNEIKPIGIGLDKMYNIVFEIFPNSKIIQLDGDILKKKKIAEEAMIKINNHEYDIILGTDVISKGYNFNKVSLVVILNVDQKFFIPHFMMTEETIQSVIQVSGRAGRKEGEGQVLIEAWNDMSELQQYFKEKNYLEYAKFELKMREQLLLPPYIKLALLVIKSNTENEAIQIIKIIYEYLINKLTQKIKDRQIYVDEPIAAMIRKVKKKYYYQIKIKTIQYKYIEEHIKYILSKYSNQTNYIFYIPNPILTFYE